jgi:N-acetyl-anhydromuramyl-L-alanine amidase AmpD
MIVIPAKHFTRVNAPRRIDLVVLHSMESGEKPGTARQVAEWFARGERQVSAHYCVDADEIVKCLDEDAVAWCAPGANNNGVHIELAGRANQSFLEWMDAYSKETLIRAAELTADICKRHSIPPQLVDVAGLIHRHRGITTHAAVSQAFRKTTHTDPGRDFPLTWFVARVAKQVNGGV